MTRKEQKPSSIDFDLRQLEIFSRVVELGSFSKAADIVFLAQASVSERISNLEAMVGTRLLDRLGRQVVPTKAGELLYKHAALLLEMKKTAILEMNDFLGVKKGELQIGASTIPGEYILPRIFGQFRKKYPLISVIMTIADSREIERLVVRGDLELGVIGYRPSSKTVLSHELWHDDLVVVASAEHRWAGRTRLTIEELCDEPFISREEGSGTLKSMEDALKLSGPGGESLLRMVARFGTSTAVKEGIKAGLGISILSSRAVDTELETGILKALKIKGVQMSRSFYLIRDKRRIASPLSQAMIDFLLNTRD